MPSKKEKSKKTVKADKSKSTTKKKALKQTDKNKKKKVNESKGDGNLANNYPPYDKVTKGDVVAGAKGEDQQGGKKKKSNKKSLKESFDSLVKSVLKKIFINE